MPPCRLTDDGTRSPSQVTADRHDAVLDRQAVVRTERIDPDRPHDLHLVEGPPKVSIHDRLLAQLEQAAEYAAADASVESYTLSASVTLKDGSSFAITV